MLHVPYTRYMFEYTYVEFMISMSITIMPMLLSRCYYNGIGEKRYFQYHVVFFLDGFPTF